MTPLLLALDTSTPAVTAAVHDGTRVLAEATVVDARRHGELLAPQVAEVLAAAGLTPQDLTAVAVGVGPGPFTGLRVGVVTALTLGLALGIPVHGVCSLDALAWRAALDGPFVVATDARRREVYWARYATRAVRVGDAAVARPSDVADRLDGVPVVGPGAELYAEVFAAAVPGGGLQSGAPGSGGPIVGAPLSAGALAEVALAALTAGAALLPARPLYLRRPDATPPGARKPVLA